MERTVVSARVGRQGDVSRRTFLRTLAAGSAGLAGLGWRDLVMASAPSLASQGKAVIVLWMQGGPTQFETFNPKPGSEGCMTKTIATAVPGIEIADFWPNVAAQMKDIAIIRSMTNKEGNHQRATYQMHTGYVPSGTLRHPSFGSLVASEIAPKEFDLPSFVSIQGPSMGSGFLSTSYSPFRVQDPSQLPVNSKLTVPSPRFERRMSLMESLEGSYAQSGAAELVEDHRGIYGQASKMVLSPRLTAFDLSKESADVRAKYGSSSFGQGCLLARRLVEAGVTYIEVMLTGWDTHQQNHDRVKDLASRCDVAFATLIADLKARGLLDRTLVTWMGEFGRTPRVNPNAGRDHYPRAFNVAVAGNGVHGGQVIGKTSDNGADVVDAPVTPTDLFFSFAKSLGINPAKENQSPVGRPLKIVDGGKPVAHLFS